MSCSNCGAVDLLCCCGGNVRGHCDSTAFESDCTDGGQAFPLSIKVSCAAPVYTPIPDEAAVWNGVSWAIGVSEPDQCPSILEQPASMSVMGGATGELSVSLNSTPTGVTYKWQVFDAPDWLDLAEGEITDVGQVNGVTTDTLALAYAFSGQDAFFRVVVNFLDCDPVVSDPGHITVL